MQQHTKTIGNALHNGSNVGQSVEGGCDFYQNAGATMLLARKLVQPERFKSGAKLRRENCNFRYGVIVKTRAWRTSQECNRAHRFSRHHQRRSQCGMRVDRSQPGIARCIQMIDKKSAALLNRIHGDGCVPGTPANSMKGLGLFRVSLGADELAVRRATPKICTCCLKEGSRKGTKRSDQVTRIGALKCGSRKLEQQFLKSLVRVRRVLRTRISVLACQRGTICSLST